MAYFLRQDKKKKGIYLQMYDTYWDKEKKQPRSKSIESFGYVDDLISAEMPEPIAHYEKYVSEKNAERKIQNDKGERKKRSMTFQLVFIKSKTL